MSKVNIGLNKLLQALFFELLTALRRIFDTGIYVYIYIYMIVTCSITIVTSDVYNYAKNMYLRYILLRNLSHVLNNVIRTNRTGPYLA